MRRASGRRGRGGDECVGLAYKGTTSTIGVPAKTMPGPTSSGDVVSVEKRKAELRKQLDQVQREASP